MDPAHPVPENSDNAALHIKLLTLNTHKGFSSSNRRFVLHELREAVRGIAADIVCLQEVVGSHEKWAAEHRNWPPEPQYEFLADAIWGNVAYGRNAVYTEGHHGNAVLSKFPIIHFENHDISVGGSEQRGLLHCVLRPPQAVQDLHVICTHFALHEHQRREQTRKLCALIENRVPPTAPLFVAGDFNDWRNRIGAVLSHDAQLNEAFAQQNGRVARSFPARFPLLRLDRVYFRSARALDAVVLSSRPWSRLSDHAALLAKFTP